MPRRFTLREAQALVPRLGALLAEAIRQKQDYSEAEGVIRAEARRVEMMGGVRFDREAAIESRRRVNALADGLRKSIVAIEATGCEVKDLDTGLLDFPSVYRGEEVCLCWKYGESEILYWHRASEGFGGRKPIDADFFENHGPG